MDEEGKVAEPKEPKESGELTTARTYRRGELSIDQLRLGAKQTVRKRKDVHPDLKVTPADDPMWSAIDPAVAERVASITDPDAADMTLFDVGTGEGAQEVGGDADAVEGQNPAEGNGRAQG